MQQNNELNQDNLLRLRARAVKGKVPVAINALISAEASIKRGEIDKAKEQVQRAREWLKKRGA